MLAALAREPEAARLYAAIPSNERSVRVLERAGFVVEGYARKYLFIGGRLRDHLLTSLSNPALETPEAFLNAGAR